MKTWALMLAAFFGLVACNAQEQNHQKTTMADGSAVQVHPQSKWKVTKKLDDNGNVIGYDSTYVSVYSSVNGQQQDVNIDSMMEEMSKGMGGDMFSHFSFGDGDDSSFFNDFASPEKLMHGWDNFPEIKRMMQRMDSLRNPELDNRQELMDLHKA